MSTTDTGIEILADAVRAAADTLEHDAASAWISIGRHTLQDLLGAASAQLTVQRNAWLRTARQGAVIRIVPADSLGYALVLQRGSHDMWYPVGSTEGREIHELPKGEWTVLFDPTEKETDR